MLASNSGPGPHRRAMRTRGLVGRFRTVEGHRVPAPRQRRDLALTVVRERPSAGPPILRLLGTGTRLLLGCPAVDPPSLGRAPFAGVSSGASRAWVGRHRPIEAGGVNVGRHRTLVPRFRPFRTTTGRAWRSPAHLLGLASHLP